MGPSLDGRKLDAIEQHIELLDGDIAMCLVLIKGGDRKSALFEALVVNDEAIATTPKGFDDVSAATVENEHGFSERIKAGPADQSAQAIDALTHVTGGRGKINGNGIGNHESCEMKRAKA